MYALTITVTVPDRFPRIDELVDMVGHNEPKVFLSLDLM